MKNEKSIITEAFAIGNGKIWISDMKKNAFFVCDRKDGKCKLISTFIEENLYEFRLHCKAIFENEKVYFLPDRGKHIHVVCINSYKMKSILLEVPDVSRFSNGFIYNGSIYMLQTKPYKAIHKVDIACNEQKTIKLLGETEEKGLIGKTFVFLKPYLYIINTAENFVYKYNCENDRYQKIKIEGVTNGFGSICYDGVNFYLSSQREIIKWDEKTGKTIFYNEFPKNYGMIYLDADKKIKQKRGFEDVTNSFEQPFLYSFVRNGKIYFLPCRVNMSVVLDPKNGLLQKDEIFYEKEDETSLWRTDRVTQQHYIGHSIGENEYIMSTATGTMYSFLPDSKIEKVILKEKILEWSVRYVDNLLLTETEDTNLNDYILAIKDK